MARLFTAIAVLAVLAGGAEARERAISLTVSVFNDARVPPAVLEAAGRRARLVLEDAGVALTWIDCGSPGHRPAHAGCSAISFPTHLSVRIMAEAPPASEDAFGQSFLDDREQGSYAYVYASALASPRFLELVDRGDLVGYVVAHEIGHLLLGRGSHSADGLMCPVWQTGELVKAGKGSLFFSAGEKRRIRTRYLTALERPEAEPRAEAGR